MPASQPHTGRQSQESRLDVGPRLSSRTEAKSVLTQTVQSSLGLPSQKHLRGGMKILAARIRRQLLLDTGKWGHCAIYENELQRIWPLNEENRKTKIEQFAKEYGFHVSYYKQGLCAIFEKQRPPPT